MADRTSWILKGRKVSVDQFVAHVVGRQGFVSIEFDETSGRRVAVAFDNAHLDELNELAGYLGVQTEAVETTGL